MTDTAPTTVTLDVDGREYPLDFSAINALDALAMRTQTGLAPRQMLSLVMLEPDIDVIAAYVWLSRRRAGETELPFVEVANDITYATEYGVVREASPAPPATPED